VEVLGMIDRGEFLPSRFSSKQQFIEFFVGGWDSYQSKALNKFILENPHWSWPCAGINRSFKATIELLEHFAAKDDQMWFVCSQNECITFDYVLANLDKKWNWQELSRHPNITLDDITTYPDLPWDYEWVAGNKTLTWDFVIQHQKKFGYGTYWVSQLPCVTIDTVRKNPDFPWDWRCLSINANIDYGVIKANSDLPWDLNYFLSMNPNATIENVMDNPQSDWDWLSRTMHKNTTYETITATPELPWRYDVIWANPNFTVKTVDAHPEGINGHPWVILSTYIKPDLTREKIMEFDRKGMLEWL